MRANLWDDPRVAALCEVTGCAEAHVIGGLYWLWAAVSRHGRQGQLPNLPARQIDRKTGIPGFAEALVAIDWLRADGGGVVIPRFDEHRLPEADAPVGPSNSPVTGDQRVVPTQAGLVCRAMRQVGCQDVNPGHAGLLMLLQSGATQEEFVGAAREAAERRRGFAYALAIVTKRREEAALQAKGLHQGSLPAGPAPTVPSRDADRTQQYLRADEMTPQQRAEAAAKARELREARSKTPQTR
jgi:hypothetical protein